MKRTHIQKKNDKLIALIDAMQNTCTSKRARLSFKYIMKEAPEIAMCTTMSGAILPYISAKESPINVVWYNAKQNEILDHGRWILTLAYMLKSHNQKLNLYIKPYATAEDKLTPIRALLDYIIDNHHHKQIHTTILQGEFHEVIEYVGIDNIDVVFNHNPTIDDHNNHDARSALHSIVKAQIPYVISDITPVSMYFKAAFFSAWGVSSTCSMQKNQYPVTVKKEGVGVYNYMGYMLNLNTLLDDANNISQSEAADLNVLANALMKQLKYRDRLVKFPSIDDENNIISAFKSFEYSQKTNVAKCDMTGDTYRVSVVPPSQYPSIADAVNETEHKIKTILWSLSLFSQYESNLEKRRVAS